jgi:Flp pilus assembly protein TadG
LRIRTLKTFARDQRANVAVTFGLAAVPLVMLVGMGLDIANATRVKTALQNATDSAAISLARQAPTITDAQVPATAKAYIQANYRDTSQVSVTNASIDRATITATLDAKADVPVAFSQLLGVSSLPITAHAVAKGLLLEIAVVLDTSGSMSQSAGSGGSKINALKSAGDAFLDAMFGASSTSQRVSVSVVPFAASVNVGSSNANAAWIDTTGRSSLHFEDFSDSTKSRWNLISDLNSTSWKGCVISRPTAGDLDVTDVAPSSTNGDTLFVPWFAPDEPDNNSNYANSYIKDTGNGGCSASLITLILNSLSLKQKNNCKYKNSTKSGAGPNYLCDSTPITSLSGNRAVLDPAISSLQAAGNTNIEEGLMWGWRSISPGAPFTQGKPYGAPNNRKVIILMTDGENNLGGNNNSNLSEYSSYGYAVSGHLGSPTNNNSTLTSELNARTLKACANAKAQGILIYTIAFGSGATASQNLLRTCASDPKYYYAPQNSSDLVPVFKNIAQSVNSLRIAE